MAQNHYEVLGVGEDAGPEEIRKAYRSLARTYHPDTSTHPNATEMFERITEAYVALSDPEIREEYDLDLKADNEKSEPPQDEYSKMADYEYICEEKERFLINGREVVVKDARHLIIGDKEYVVNGDGLIDIGGIAYFDVDGPEKYLVDGVERTLNDARHFIQKGVEYVFVDGKPFAVKKQK